MKQRLLALILSLSLLIGLMPVTAMAVGEGAGTGSTVADTSTLTSWKSVFGTNGDLSTKDIGRIWTDKTVSTNDVTLTGDIDNGNSNSVTITKETDADFLVGLSALGSAAKITGETSIPTDTMIVLDVSPKMEDSVDAMLKAANAALKSLLESNSNNRVGVVTYDNTAAVILPLGTYLNYSGGRNEPILSLSGREITATGMTGTGTVGGSFSFDNGAYRNYQFGMYFAMQELYEAENKKVEINGVHVSRTPVVIALASGEPEVGSSTFISVNEDQGNRDIGPETALYNKASAHIAQTFVALLTAGYWKDQVTQAYYSGDGDKAARVYTVAVGDLTYNSDESLAEAALNPVALTESSKVGSEDTNLYDALADYNNGRVTLRRAEGRYGVSTEDVTISKANNNNVTVTWEQIQYNDAFFQAEDMNSEADWTDLFEQILSEVTTQLPTAPTETEEGAAGTGGESGKLIFTDELGRFMEVTGTPTLVFAGTEHEAISSTTSGNTTTYIFEGEVTGNPVYGDADLSEIVLKVTTENNQQTLTWEIPAKLLPLRTVDVTGTSDGGGTTYTIDLEKSAYPIRLFYSVAKNENATYSAEDNNYFAQKSKDGQTDYYSNDWTGRDYGDTTAVFTPAATNAFYHYTEDTLLYQLVNRGQANRYLSETEAENGGATFIAPGQGTVTVGGIVYTLEPASEYVADRAYYYAHTYYQETGSGNAAQVYTDYHMIEDGSRLPGVTEQANDHLYITQGTNKLSRVSDADSEKSDDIDNSTGTATQVRHPEYSLTEGAKVTIYLGNNGKLTEATPMGDLTVEVGQTTGQGADPDQEFTYTLELYNSQENSYEPLTGTYTLTVYNKTADGDWEADTSAGQTTISNGDTFTLKAGQKAVVSGLPAGSVFRVTQESEAGYTPAYTSLDHNNEYPSGGGIRWRNDGKQTPYGQITVVNTYDVTQNTFALTYNANAQGGRVDNLPDGQTASGGTVTLSETVPKHAAVSGKKVLFLGWSETKTTQIYGKDNKAAYEAIQTPVYDAGDQFPLAKDTDLYAVWGYDENDDNQPDVTEQLYTLTYDANDGTFTDSSKIKTEQVLEQKGYSLENGEKPTHAQAEWDGKLTDVIFVGWSTTQDKTIYSVNDTRPATVTTIDITADNNNMVYAVWGFDGDGDRIPDIDNQTHKITVTTGEGGSADVEYSYNKTQMGTLANSTTNTYYVVDGENLTVNIEPAEKMAVDTITVDGKAYVNNGKNTLPDGNSWTSYTFSKVTKDHTIAITFAKDEDGNKVPDKNEYTLTYNANEGTGAPEKETGLIYGETYKLSQEEPTHEDETWNRQTVKVLFVGWTTDERVQGEIYSIEDTAPNTITRVTITGNTTVYAVWGYDADGDGQPDVTENTKYTITASWDDNQGDVTAVYDAPEQTSATSKVWKVASGSNLTVNIEPAEKMAVDTITVDDTTYTNNGTPNVLPDGNKWTSYTFSNVAANHTIAITFAEDADGDGVPDKYQGEYTVTAQAKDGNGSITPPVSIVSAGEDVEFTITAAEKFALDYVTVNGDVVYANNDASNKFAGTWTLKDVREDCTVVAFFGADDNTDGIPDNPSYYTMTISAGKGGSIAPSGTVFVKSGEGLSLTITPNTDYHISDVVVDGSSVGAVGSYTLSNVQGNHTIAAYFAKDSSDPGTRDDYTLHYVTNGGKHLSSETKSSAWTKDYEDLPTPVRDGYTFEGWYWDLRLTEPVTGDVKVDKTTVTLYAKWSNDNYGPDDTGVSSWLETDEHNAFLSGYPDGSFQADKNMTRAEVAQMFYSLLLDKDVEITKSFSDVPADAWYAKAVNTLSSLGMLGGYPDGTFRPDAPITRAEFAAIALAFAYDPASASCSYTDVSTSAWYYTYVAQATTYGWIGGYPDGSFRPNNSITRAEVAVIVNNMLGRDADESYIDRNADELVSFVDLSKTHWAYYTIMEATNSHDYTSASSGETWTRVK